MIHETFWTLLADPAHWEFELFLIFLFDILIGAILFPRLKSWKTHHRSDDKKIEELEKKVAVLERFIGSFGG